MFKKLQNKIFSSNSRKNIIKISSGTTLGFAISIITLPIITRIYGAEIIGLWALLNSFALIIKSISDLGLTNTIMVDSEENLEKNYKVITTTSAISSLVISLVVTLLYAIFFNSSEINIITFFLILVLLTFTIQQTQICYTWLNRNSKYNVLMKNPLINNLIIGILSIVFGLSGFTAYGYFIAQIIGQIVTLIHMKRNLPQGWFTFKLEDFREVFQVNKKFIIFQTPTNMIGVIKSQLPVLLIELFWGAKMLGYYSIAIKLLQIPSALLATAIGRVFFQTTSSMNREGKSIGTYVFRNISGAIKIAIIPIALLIAYGDFAAIIFLGEEWVVAGNFIRILALYFFFAFLITSVQGLSITLNKQNFTLIFTTAQLVASVASLSIGKFLFNSVYIALIIMSVVFIIITILYFCYLFSVMELKWNLFVKKILFNLFLVLILSVLFRCVFIAFGTMDLINTLF